ncbi:MULTISPECIES: DJ-1/PfpI family protein [unclassified Photobacterium]|uniref:DJ-1/PfpI family protein n=1 Tax=unclassified Photobacterium TaxID=2628852 RepID=UPI001B8C776A|nr:MULTISPECIES: DJ-1/PfpI family protein [unclassified Photobacterium]MDO6706851.1 DJ-1/PfpI family protein [Photobacterium sp. 1_MG-2023]QUJ70085.1 DJ-1/PfpI family protein [Photobacterium sp. GJ3]
MTEALAPDKRSGLHVLMLLYPDFNLLDISGPATLLAALDDEVSLSLISAQGTPVTSQQGVKLIADASFEDDVFCDVLLVPGGEGVQAALENSALTTWLCHQTRKARICCSVCTGAALLAQTEILNGKSATTNKQHYHWVSELNDKVQWQPVARWVEDDHRFTASGTAAGLDMTLGLICFLMGEETARKVAIDTEYLWRNDPDDDPFAPLHLVE